MILTLDRDPHNSFWIKESYSILVRLYDKGFRTEAPLALEYIGSALTEMERQLQVRAQVWHPLEDLTGTREGQSRAQNNPTTPQQVIKL